MLDSNAKIKDIIASLQETEGINQKAELKSVLQNKGVEVSDEDNMVDLVSKISKLIIAKGNARVQDVIAGKTFSNDTRSNLVGTATVVDLGGKSFAQGVYDNILNYDNDTFSIILNFTPQLIVLYYRHDDSGNGFYDDALQLCDIQRQFITGYSTPYDTYAVSPTLSHRSENGVAINGNVVTITVGLEYTISKAKNIKWFAIG